MQHVTCVECGSTFEADRCTAKTCSDECKAVYTRRYYRNRRRREYVAHPITGKLASCAWCDRSFSIAANNQRFCSEQCRVAEGKKRRKAARHAEGRQCTYCGATGLPVHNGIAVCDSCRKAGPRERPRAERRLRQYGITQAQYDAMWSSQGQCCAICKTTDPGARNWHIDHCHDSREVRGILCQTCNVGLGMFKDDPAILAAATKYATNHAQLRLVI